MKKSPFLVIERFLTPKKCEDLLNDIRIIDSASTLTTNNVIHDDIIQEYLVDTSVNVAPHIDRYYEVNCKRLEDVEVHSIISATKPQSDSCSFINGNWVKTDVCDFTGVLFLQNFNNCVEEEMDLEFEIFGGLLEFPQHRFGIPPQRGTLIIFPSEAHFIHYFTQPDFETLYVVKFKWSCEQTYLYNPRLFPGTYIDWFKQEEDKHE